MRKGYFTVGSSRDEVIALQGTPTMVQGNSLVIRNTQTFLFVDGKVRSVTDFSASSNTSRRIPSPSNSRRHFPVILRQFDFALVVYYLGWHIWFTEG